MGNQQGKGGGKAGKKKGKKGGGGAVAEDSGASTPAAEETPVAIENATQEIANDEPVLEYSKDKSEKPVKEDFELLQVIGKGSFGKVMQVKKKSDGNIYAMKVLRKEAIIARKQVTHTKAERSILEKINHPFIVQLHYAFQSEDKLYMILDYVNGGELFFHLKREGKFPEDRVAQYAAQIASALAHLHGFDIVYRDLKPENILLDAEGHIRITDFGLSKQIESEDGTHTFCGTPEYLAPEVLKGKGHGCAVDWWSLGTLVFEMLTGLPPYYSQNINIMYQKILNGELRFPPYISEKAKSFLTGLLTRDVDERLGSNGFDEIKNHPFFEDIDWDKLLAKDFEPSFKPDVSGELDTSNIDPVFTSEQAVDSLVEKSALDDPEAANFEGFTFVAESDLAGEE